MVSPFSSSCARPSLPNSTSSTGFPAGIISHTVRGAERFFANSFNEYVPTIPSFSSFFVALGVLLNPTTRHPFTDKRLAKLLPILPKPTTPISLTGAAILLSLVSDTSCVRDGRGVTPGSYSTNGTRFRLQPATIGSVNFHSASTSWDDTKRACLPLVAASRILAYSSTYCAF